MNLDTKKSSKSPSVVRVQMLGKSGVGKTCFIAGLALLNDRTDGKSYILPTNDYTKSVFDALRETLKKGYWPSKTSITEEITFAVIKNNRRVDVVLTDFAGESFTNAMTRGEASDQTKIIQSMINDADILLALIDGAAINKGENIIDSPLIQGVFERLSSENKKSLDIAIVVTKVDLCDILLDNKNIDIKSFLKQRVSGLAKFIDNKNITNHYFAVSVCGKNGVNESGLPDSPNLKPQGYEKLTSLLFKHNRRPHNRLLMRLFSLLVVLLFLISSWKIHQYRNILIERDRIKILPVTEIGKVHSSNEPYLRDIYLDFFEIIKKEIETAKNSDTIEKVKDKLNNLPSAHNNLISGNKEELILLANNKYEDLLYNRIKDNDSTNTHNEALILEYLSKYPNGTYSDELREIIIIEGQQRYIKARNHIKKISVTSPETLKFKLESINHFIQDFGKQLQEEEKQKITDACNIAKMLLEIRQYHCKLVRTSRMDGKRRHAVKILVDNEVIVNYTDSGDTSEKNWNSLFSLSWNSGKNIKVILTTRDTWIWSQEMAYFIDSSPIAITLLANESKPTHYNTGAGTWLNTDFSETSPPFKIIFECEELPSKKIEIIHDYLLPGDKW